MWIFLVNSVTFERNIISYKMLNKESNAALVAILEWYESYWFYGILSEYQDRCTLENI